MAAGKSTIGRALARKLNKNFYDTDAEITKGTGVAISLIFELEGENGFRKRETGKLKQLSEIKNSIIATGGGTVLSVENREVLKKTGHIIYLECSVAQQLKRTKYDTVRPLLKVKNPRLKLEELMRVRAPIYESLADILINTEKPSSKHVIDKIIRQLEEIA
ncbi:MAG: shikimate kinase [Cycloclasticus sp. symbiont of Poecilosclerida sp. M]|nr:MAG: shikimate kinase [Cycloclasticus sp. symbiont of Poecilosclerida sp. M]